MHKQGCQNERAPVILLRLTFFIEGRVAIDRIV